MFAWLKKHFIPHDGNNHRPHILRDVSARNIVAVVIFLEIFTFLIPVLNHISTGGGMAAVLPAVLADLTNEEREMQNLPVLTVSPILNKAAEMKAEDMAALGYFAHTSPAGKTPWYWIEQVGYKYQYAGENLAVNFTDSKDVTVAWMNSPTHKANIVKGNYTEIGTGVASGIYQGKEAIFVAQVYANPLPVIPKQNISIKPAVPAQIAAPNPSSGEKTSAINKPINVLGAETTASGGTPPEAVVVTSVQPPTPTFWQKLLASPRNTTDIILYIVFALIALSLISYILIKMKNHHKDLITNGLIVLAVILAIFIGNYYFTHRNMVITDSFDYSNQNI
jgi:hypothetical protein